MGFDGCMGRGRPSGLITEHMSPAERDRAFSSSHTDPFSNVKIRVFKAVIKAKGGYLKNLKYKIYFDMFNTFLVTT